VRKVDILDKFLDNVKKTLTEGYYDVEECPAERVSLREKLDNQFVVITEIKHASPSGEYSYKRIDPEKAAMDFRESGSDAISVVVEPKIFRGNLKNIPLAKKAGLPILFKDFVISEKQIEAARNVDADCMLLVVKALDRMDLDLDEMVKKAHHNGLEVLVESYDENEMKRAMDTDADVLGINNRDLRTLKVDIGSTERIMKAVGEVDRPLISESGIKTADDVRFVRKTGARGVLVGTAIWKADDLKAKIRELKRGANDE